MIPGTSGGIMLTCKIIATEHWLFRRGEVTSVFFLRGFFVGDQESNIKM